ncbi:unnamed protein product, partial [Meganyctiphanes norvegica]
AQGNGEKLVWQKYGTEISSTNSLWWPILPDPGQLQFNNKEVFVSPNEKVHLYCGMGTDYSYCIWEKDTNIITLEDVNKGLYRGISRPEKSSNNQCGLVLDQASLEDQGIWTCKVYRNGKVFMDSKKVTLTVNGISTPPCYSECGIEHDWVCGSDGNSYQNPCQLLATDCEYPAENITIKHNTRCENIKGECPNEVFKLRGTQHQFIIFQDVMRNWPNAMKKCETEFLRKVHPSDQVAVQLRKYILESCGDVPVWLNARSDGTKFVWQDNKIELNREDDLWLKGDPTSIFDILWHYLDKRISSNHCLNLAVWFENWSERPRRVYASTTCSTRFYTICEECPVGFFRLKGSRQCFKLLKDVQRSWGKAQGACLDENSVLATPSDEIAVALRKYILDKYGELDNGGKLWLDGMAHAGSGRVMLVRNQTKLVELSGNHSLWQPDEPVLRDADGRGFDSCLRMHIAHWVVAAYPTQVYYTRPCTDHAYTLCEAIFE